jgi:hypothetical protein
MVLINAIKAIAKGKAKLRAPKLAHIIHKGEYGFHLAYFGGVFAEGHGFYRYAAAVVLVLMVASIFVVEEAAEAAAEVA